MPQKRKASPAKRPSLPGGGGEENQNMAADVSANIPSQSSKKPISKSPQSDPTIEEEQEEADDEDSENENAKASKIQPESQKPAQPRKGKEDAEEEQEQEESDDDDESGSDWISDHDSPPPKAKSAHVEAMRDAVKRSAPDSSEKQSKKKRQKQQVEDAVVEEEDEQEEQASAKKPLIQRIWSEENEVSILKGVIEYMNRTGVSDVSLDLTGFHEFVKESLHVDMTRSQVSEKIRRMKRKYQNNAEKAMRREEPTFTRDHDNLLYQLSEQIWGDNGSGNGGGAGKKGRANSKKSKKNASHGLREDMEVPYPWLSDMLQHSTAGGLTENEVKEVLASMGQSRAKEWDDLGRKLRLKEIEIYQERAMAVSELLKEYREQLAKSS